eukprot:8677753-Pyramimonas_sp.AAC.1
MASIVRFIFSAAARKVSPRSCSLAMGKVGKYKRSRCCAPPNSWGVNFIGNVQNPFIASKEQADVRLSGPTTRPDLFLGGNVNDGTCS